ncbi:PucR family transcriptional regulator [Streptomyces hoynatensis]|uniref:PucR family transcriptional regulator n=1 Tax=Streptomyces hoynatensis TaxID=1141874 RepID=A0A3A9YQM4_9ACTN|nr:PucR family transcriptional regulator ligand-binding domain-containing protein [Streptomyces hoynatensis]RKN38292.1 PucR family transcriptional regulator [Streptomyces hoynatensis]
MRLRTLLEGRSPGLRLLTGEGELDRLVRGVMTTDLRDPSRYLRGGELVLTGLAWWRSPADAEPFVRVLVAAGVAGLAAGEAEFGAVPTELTAACARHGLPLFAVAEEVGFAELTEHVLRRVSGERAGDLAAVVERHRRLRAAGGPRAVLELLASHLDLPAWLLTSTGREVPAAPGPLPGPVARELAARWLAAAWRGAPHLGTTVEGVEYTLFPVPEEPGRPGGEGAPGGRGGAPLTDWLLVVQGGAADWPAERLGLLGSVAALLAEERGREDAAPALGRRLVREVFTLLGTGAPAAELAARLRLAAPVLAPGRAAPHWQVAVARLEPPEGADAGSGAAARGLLSELFRAPAVTGREGEAAALLPVPSADAAFRAEAVLAPVRPALAAGLRGGGRLTLGLSAAVDSAEGLPGALEEARHARRVAAAGPGAVRGAGHEELASHVLLLPFVPEDVRRAFTSRLLEPLREYDRAHHSDLLATLEAFLEADGSWTRCAARLHLHVNTLRYRIGRIEQLTGRALTRLEDKVDFFLALRMN